MNERGHQLDSVNQAWSGAMKQAAFKGKHALFADSRKVPPRWKIAKAHPLGRSPALRKTARQEKDDFRRLSSQLIDSDARRRLSCASQARISASQPHHLRNPIARGDERIKPGKTKKGGVILRGCLFCDMHKSCFELSDQPLCLRHTPCS